VAKENKKDRVLMFLYKTEVKPATNPAMGLGLFALEFIPNQSIVWEYKEGFDIRFDPIKLNELNEAQQAHFKKYAWLEKMASDDKEYYYCNADLCGFTNHSKNPNISSRGHYTIAIKNIEIGQEILIDYSEFDSLFSNYEKDLI
jgi:SET domain-containing protein